MTKEQKILLLFVLLIAGSGTALYVSKSGTASTPTATQSIGQTNTATVPSTTEPAATTNTGTSVSGTVTGSGVTTGATANTSANKTIVETLTYQTPEENQEEITVTAVVDASGNIVDVTFTHGTPHKRESKEYLGKFVAALPAAKTTLVGTKIGSKQLSRVGGASLTTAAFNKALTALATKVTG